MKLSDFHVLQECPWFMDYSIVFYSAEEEVERKATIGSTPFDASQDASVTNNVDFQSVQEGVVIQTENAKGVRRLIFYLHFKILPPMMQQIYLLL